VHDVVANGLYRIMTQMEHQPDFSKTQLLDNIEALYERSRDISYEQQDQPSLAFDLVIGELLSSFANEHTIVLITGNESTLWEGLPSSSKNELEKVLSELMVNMKKHSGAENVLVKFQRKAGRIQVHYMDDGKGFPTPPVYGNGLTSTENRIISMNGNIIFTSPENKGLSIDFDIPIPTA
jgi:signal transduction histidine kinase